MTDNEIIKALKMWLREGDCNGECPLLEMGYCFDCACVPPEIASGILDLVNRQKIESNKYRNRVQSQKGEITRLHKKVAELTAELEEQKAEIERLREEKQEIKDNFDCQQTVYLDLSKIIKEQADELKTAKSEAIKEFAERLKDEMRLEDDCQYDCMNCLYECKGYVPIIDNLVKERTEVETNQRKEDEGK